MSGKNDCDSYEESGPDVSDSFEDSEEVRPAPVKVGRGRRGGAKSRSMKDFIDYDDEDSMEDSPPSRGRGKRARDYDDDDDEDSLDESPTKIARRGRGRRGRARGTTPSPRARGAGRARGTTRGAARGRARGRGSRGGRAPKEDFSDMDDDFKDEEDYSSVSRRSTRNAGKRKSYSRMEEKEDSVEESSDSGAETVIPEPKVKAEPKGKSFLDTLPKSKVLEKILAHRAAPESDPPVYEFFVKWKMMSHIHAEWVPQTTIESSRMGSSRLKKFLSRDMPLDPRSCLIRIMFRWKGFARAKKWMVSAIIL